MKRKLLVEVEVGRARPGGCGSCPHRRWEDSSCRIYGNRPYLRRHPACLAAEAAAAALERELAAHRGVISPVARMEAAYDAARRAAPDVTPPRSLDAAYCHACRGWHPPPMCRLEHRDVTSCGCNDCCARAFQETRTHG